MGEAAYEKVNALWTTVPPCTREEAVRATWKIRKHFRMMKSRQIRTCWISLRGGTLDKGWPRLVHDLSHRQARLQFPRARPHGPHHAAIEREMVEYVLEQGWLTGKLRPKERERKAKDPLAHAQAQVARWETKLKRTTTLLKKWQRKLRYYERKVA
jgi:hypothetical protein